MKWSACMWLMTTAPSRSPSERSDCLEDRGGVSLDRDARPDLHDRPVRPGEERRALDTDALLPVHVLLDDHPECVADLRRGVGQQRKVQPVLLGELLLRGDVVAADADDRGSGGAECALLVTKGLRLGRAARRIRLRIEIDDQLASGEVAQTHHGTVLRDFAGRKLVVYF